MPQIIEMGKGQNLQRAAAGAIQGIQLAMQQKSEADRLGLAREQFKFQQDQAGIGNDFRQQSLDLQKQGMEFNQDRAIKGDQRADTQLGLAKNADARSQQMQDARMSQIEMSDQEREAMTKWGMDKVTSYGILSLEQLAVLGNAGPDVIMGVADELEHKQLLNDGAQRLDGLTQMVLQAMYPDPEQPMDPNNPAVLALTEGLNGSVGTLEGQAAFKKTLVGALQQIEEQKADARDRVEFSMQMKPMMQQFTANMPTNLQGMMSANLMLYESGEIEKADLLDEWSKIVKASDGGTSGRTPDETFLNSTASSLGTLMGRRDEDEGFVDPETVKRQFSQAQGIAASMRGGAESQQAKQSATPSGGPTEPASKQGDTPVLSRRDLDRAFGKDTLDEAIRMMPSDPERRDKFALQKAAALIRKTGGTVSDASVVLIADSLLTLADE